MFFSILHLLSFLFPFPSFRNYLFVYFVSPSSDAQLPTHWGCSHSIYPWFPELSFQIHVSVLWTHLSVTLHDVGTLAKSPLKWPFHDFLPPIEASSGDALGTHTHILGSPRVNRVWVLSLRSILLGQGNMGAGWAHPLPAPRVTVMAQVPSDTFSPACWFLIPLELEIRGFEITCPLWRHHSFSVALIYPYSEDMSIHMSFHTCQSLSLCHKVLWHLLPWHL